MLPLFDIAVIGRGSTAAYFLNTLEKDPKTRVLVIGKENPWAGKRGTNPNTPGDPVNVINQTAQMIAFFEKMVPGYAAGGYESLVRRTNFARAAEDVIKSVATKIIDDELESITPLFDHAVTGIPGIHGCKVKTMAGESFFALRVLVATGAGEHMVPEEVEPLKNHLRVMNMDAFANKARTIPRDSTVFVMGPNAAIDTVETARFNGFKVVWLVRGAGVPQLLGTNHQTFALAQKHLNYKEGTLKVELDARQMIRVTATTSTGATVDETGNYFVYATGQALSENMKKVIDGLKTNGGLEPVFDVDQRFGGAHESVLGFQVKGSRFVTVGGETAFTGVQVIGALAPQVSKLLDPSAALTAYLDRMKDAIKEVQVKFSGRAWLWNAISLSRAQVLFYPPNEAVQRSTAAEVDAARERLLGRIGAEHQTEINRVNALANLLGNCCTVADFYKRRKAAAMTKNGNNEARARAAFWEGLLAKPAEQLTGSTAQSPQLGNIRSQMVSLNSFVPAYIADDANFSHDDRTVLRIYIALTYPLVSEKNAQDQIQVILSGRKKANNGWGYPDWAVQVFKNQLGKLQADAAGRLKTK